MPIGRRLVTLLLTITLCAGQSYAQRGTFQQRPWQRRAPASAYRARSYSSGQRAAQPPQAMQHDYRQHFLDDDDWMTDKNVRYWDVKLAASKTRGGVSFTSKLVLANIICYGIQSFYPSFTSWGVKLSDKILRGEELYRLLSPVFLHGGIYHLFTNMYSLTNVGPPMERLFGPGRYLAGYLVSGAAGNLLSAMQSPNPALGASGAVFGVMAGFYVFLSRHDWLLGDQGRAYTNGITQTLLINLVIGAMNPVVDNWGHLGGAIGGAAMAYYFGPRLYLADLPEGGRIVVDKPIMRLPRSIESIPEKVSARIQRITRRMQVWRYRADLPAKPWRPTQPGGPSDFQRRMTTPSKSIKPKQD
jgi:membrane associated rhomboid family serine protease